MNEALVSVTSEVLSAVVIALIGLIAVFVQKYTKSARIRDAIENVKVVAQGATSMVQKRTVEYYRASNTGGVLTDEQKKEVMQMVIDEVKNALPDPTIKLIESVGSDLESMITDFAEEMVIKINKTDQSVVTVTQ